MNKKLYSSNVNYSFILFVIVIYSINPIFCLLGLFFYLVKNNHYKDGLLKLIGILLALFVGCINSTKIPESDLIWYIAGYLDAGKTPFLEYLFTFGINGAGKEIVFPLFNYIIYFFVGDSPKIYIIIYSTISYSLLNIACYRFGRAIKATSSLIITSMFVMTFTPYIFAMSAILLRQFLASSILIYILVERLFYNKKMWLLIICMVLIHISAAFFVPFMFFGYLKKTIKKETFVFYFSAIVILFSIQAIAGILVPFVSGNTALSYAVTRASQDTTFDLGTLSISKILSSIFTVAIPMIYIYMVYTSYKKNKGLVHFFNILAILVLFIISNLDQSELSVRYNFYVWQFFPFSLIFILAKNKKQSLYRLLVLPLILFFVIYLDIGVWTYNIGFELFLYPLYYYVM